MFSRAVRRQRRLLSYWSNLAAYDPIRRRSRLRGPVEVQIQTVDRCNGICITCPYSDRDQRGPKQLMDRELYRDILQRLAAAGSLRQLLLTLQNEPLLDPELGPRLRLARQVLGHRVKIGLVTNGSLLTAKRIRTLQEAAPDDVSVSIDASRAETYARIHPGQDLDRINAQTQALISALGPRRVSARFLRQRDNIGEEQTFERFWREQGAQVLVHDLTNRAGTFHRFEELARASSPTVDRLLGGLRSKLLTTCALPFTALSVLCDGRVILCCHDWRGEAVMGDLSKQSLDQVWNGVAINSARQALWRRRLDPSMLCHGCSQAEKYGVGANGGE